MKDNIDYLDYYFNQGNTPAQKSFLRKHWQWFVSCALILICGVFIHLSIKYDKKLNKLIDSPPASTAKLNTEKENLKTKTKHEKKTFIIVAAVSGTILILWLYYLFRFSRIEPDGKYYRE